MSVHFYQTTLYHIPEEVFRGTTARTTKRKFIKSEATKYILFNHTAASEIGNGDHSRWKSGNGVKLAIRPLQYAEVKEKVELFLPLYAFVARYREDL
jgi:hypothetical protein